MKEINFNQSVAVQVDTDFKRILQNKNTVFFYFLAKNIKWMLRNEGSYWKCTFKYFLYACCICLFLKYWLHLCIASLYERTTFIVILNVPLVVTLLTDTLKNRHWELYKQHWKHLNTHATDSYNICFPNYVCNDWTINLKCEGFRRGDATFHFITNNYSVEMSLLFTEASDGTVARVLPGLNVSKSCILHMTILHWLLAISQ